MTSFKWKIAQKLEISWWKRYLSNKDVITYEEWKRNYWNSFLKHTEPFFDVNRIENALDAGCGPAGINMVLNCHVDAIDPLMNAYGQLEHFQYTKQSNVEYLSAEIENFKSGKSYDLVCCLNVINHVKNIIVSLKNLYRLTKPNGYILLSIDAHNYSLLKYLFRLIPGDALHPHQYDLIEYKNMLESVGFKLIGEKKIKTVS